MNIFAAVTGLTMAFILLQIISLNVEGQGGLAATQLTAAIDAKSTSLQVDTTDGFLAIDYVFLQSEIICYTSKTATAFNGLTRGCQDTLAQVHPSGTRVFNEATGAMNLVVGFNIAETMSSSGALRVVTMVPGALMHAVPKLVMWNYSYLQGTLLGVLPLVYVKYIVFYPLSAGFLIGFAVLMINVFMGIARTFL